MKISYREAVKMTGGPGAVVRGKLWGKILREFYSQPDIKSGTLSALLLGVIYGLSVALLALALPLGVAEIPFMLVGLFGAAYLAAFSSPTKTFYVFLSDRMDKEFEL